VTVIVIAVISDKLMSSTTSSTVQGKYFCTTFAIFFVSQSRGRFKGKNCKGLFISNISNDGQQKISLFMFQFRENH
jgi:hypothetical protein